MKIESKLKEIRNKKNISLEKLSEITGVSSTHLNDIENNNKIPSIYIIVKIAKCLKLEVTDLYNVKW